MWHNFGDPTQKMQSRRNGHLPDHLPKTSRDPEEQVRQDKSMRRVQQHMSLRISYKSLLLRESCFLFPPVIISSFLGGQHPEYPIPHLGSLLKQFRLTPKSLWTVHIPLPSLQ